MRWRPERSEPVNGLPSELKPVVMMTCQLAKPPKKQQTEGTRHLARLSAHSRSEHHEVLRGVGDKRLEYAASVAISGANPLPTVSEERECPSVRM